MIRVAHLITDLDTGGAEIMLRRLVEKMDRDRFANMVISLQDIGPIGQEILKLGIPVAALGMRPGRPTPGAMWRLVRTLRGCRPQVLQSWLYHADLLGLLASSLAGHPAVAWNLRCSNMDLNQYSRVTGMVVRTCAALSRFPSSIVVNSKAGKEYHSAIGYRPKRWDLIPNGFDLGRFHPDEAASPRLREELGIPRPSLLVGLVARFDPMKDHRTFLEAAALVHGRHPDVHFVMCGTRVDTANQALARWLDDLGIGEVTHLLGERRDVPYLTAALDVACSSSITEGFPTAVGEAMACAVPCVVTAAGDSAPLLGEAGVVVPPRDAVALAGALEKMIEAGPAGRGELGAAGRKRIEDNYSLRAVVGRYERMYEEIAGQCVG